MAFKSVYFSLGSNLGRREENIKTALEMMDRRFGCHYNAISRLIETTPQGFSSSHKFLNCCVLYRIYQRNPDSQKAAEEILLSCKEIERTLGRTEKTGIDAFGNRVYQDRPIDIDILFYGTETIETEELIIPHPRIMERNFVLIPLREIAKPSLKAAFPQYFSYICTE